MDKISKRSKGYAFLEYTTEEAASTALREMNGKVWPTFVSFLENHSQRDQLTFVVVFVCFQIINGWMITVDVAKKNPPKYSRGQIVTTS